MTRVSNKRILFVDNQRSIHDDYRTILNPQDTTGEALGDDEAFLFGGETTTKTSPEAYELESAYQGHEAVELVQQSVANNQNFAMAFVDVRMPPGMDGIQTIAEMWRIDPRIQVVICTAFSDYPWDTIRCRLGDSGQQFILKKPFEIIEIRQFATTLTGLWALRAASL